ncbi:MAG: hypothetical protein AB7K24_27275, partial [Gemmataceae bacterium]
TTETQMTSVIGSPRCIGFVDLKGLLLLRDGSGSAKVTSLCQHWCNSNAHRRGTQKCANETRNNRNTNDFGFH